MLAWVTLAGEVSLFDLIDSPGALAAHLRQRRSKALAERSRGGPDAGSGNRSSRHHCKAMADALRKDHRPRADRRGLALAARARVQRGPGGQGAGPDRRPSLLEPAPAGSSPDQRSLLWSRPEAGLELPSRRSSAGPIVPTSSANGATRPRGHGRYPHEAADLLLGAYTGADGGLGRAGSPRDFPLSHRPGAKDRRAPSAARTSSRSPRSSTAAPTSTGSGRTRPRFSSAATSSEPADARRPAHRRQSRSTGRRPGWDPAHGRLLIDTPYTQGIAGWVGGESASFAHLEFTTDNPFAVLVATSISDEPIATTKRLLVSAIAPCRAHRVPLGRLLEARGRRPRSAAVPPGTGLGDGRLAAQGNGTGLRPRQHGRANRQRSSSSNSRDATASRSRSTARPRRSTGSWSRNDPR